MMMTSYYHAAAALAAFAACFLLSRSSGFADAFTSVGYRRKQPTRLFLEDWVADMIDGELYRQGHKQEFENEWMEKNRGAIMSRLQQAGGLAGVAGQEGGATNLMMDAEEDYRTRRKDVKMALSDPQKYCADRCLTTGNCDVYEDFFEMTPEKVMEFCEECVLSEGEEPCDVPDAFYDLYDDLGSDSNQLRP